MLFIFVPLAEKQSGIARIITSRARIIFCLELEMGASEPPRSIPLTTCRVHDVVDVYTCTRRDADATEYDVPHIGFIKQNYNFGFLEGTLHFLVPGTFLKHAVRGCKRFGSEVYTCTRVH